MAHINGWMSIPDAYANAVFARGGWDSVTLDAQHGLYDERALFASLQALSDALPRRLVRVACNDAAPIGKALDAGADGVIAPMINSVEDAKISLCHAGSAFPSIRMMASTTSASSGT
jgi:4-hydroxy-2-oxoheptanedioate aldolase